jgi:hypothetical protein
MSADSSTFIDIPFLRDVLYPSDAARVEQEHLTPRLSVWPTSGPSLYFAIDVVTFELAAIR